MYLSTRKGGGVGGGVRTKIVDFRGWVSVAAPAPAAADNVPPPTDAEAALAKNKYKQRRRRTPWREFSALGRAPLKMDVTGFFHERKYKIFEGFSCTLARLRYFSAFRVSSAFPCKTIAGCSRLAQPNAVRIPACGPDRRCQLSR